MDHDCLQISFTLCLHIRARLLKCDTNVFPDGRTLWTSKRGWILNSRVGISFVYSVLVTSARPTFCGLECNRKCGCFYFLTSSPFTCRVCGGRLWGGGGRRGPTTWISPASAEVRTRPSVFSRPSRVSYRTIAHSSPIYINMVVNAFLESSFMLPWACIWRAPWGCEAVAILEVVLEEVAGERANCHHIPSNMMEMRCTHEKQSLSRLGGI